MPLGDLEKDLAQLDRTCEKVKDYVDQFVAHHDRSSSATVPSHRELNEAVDLLIETFRKYYAVGNDSFGALQTRICRGPDQRENACGTQHQYSNRPLPRLFGDSGCWARA
jgi:hypothetical protein